jgi:hypothetical protein
VGEAAVTIRVGDLSVLARVGGIAGALGGGLGGGVVALKRQAMMTKDKHRSRKINLHFGPFLV